MMTHPPVSIADRTARLPSGDTLAYGVFGEKRRADDPAVVLLHGYCGSSAYWEKTIPLLTEAEAGKLIVPDLRGHGLSGAPAGVVYAMTDMAKDIAQMLDALEEPRAVVIGHSLGGYVALAFAELHPERLSGFGLVHSTALPDSEEAKTNRDKAVKTIAEDGIETFVSGLVPKLFADFNLEKMNDAVARAIAIGNGTNPAAAAATALGMKARPDRSRIVREARVPVLLVAGAGDKVVPPERTLAPGAGEGVTNALLADCGHMSMMESPARLAEAIAAFARSAAEGRAE